MVSNALRDATCKARPITLALGVLALPVAGADAQPSPQWTEIATGVYAVLQPEPLRFNDSNSLVIRTGNGVVVVDAQANPVFVQEVIAGIEARLQTPVRTLINTHWHGDHTQGNQLYRQAFGESLEIVAHESVGEDLLQRAAPQHEEDMQQLAQAIEDAEARFEQGVSRDGEPLTAEDRDDLGARIERARKRLGAGQRQEWLGPTRPITKPETLQLDGLALQMLPFRAHTRGDLVVFLPQQKVLVTGDILDDLPYGGHGYPSEWIATLRELEALDFDTLVPGHGRVREGKEHLRLVLAMLEEIVAATKQAVERGTSLEDVQAALSLERFREALIVDETSQRAFESFIPDTVERAYLEARGELPHDR